MGLLSNLFMKKDKFRTDVTKTSEKPKEAVVIKDSPAPVEQKKESASKTVEWNLAEGLLKYSLDKLTEEVQKALETQGNANPIGQLFDIGGTGNIGIVDVNSSGRGEARKYTLVIHVLRKYRDRAFSHYLKTGTLDEILAYLSTESCFDDAKSSLHELSDRVDDFYAGLS